MSLIFDDNATMKEDFVCPECNDLNIEARSQFISYWGEDGPKEYICEVCETNFLVEERVDRAFYFKKV